MLRSEVLDHGFVELLDWMPRADGKHPERAIVEAARTSFGVDNISNVLTKQDERLIRRLLTDKHTSPFEMIEVKFVVRAPIFVARQWFRHRTGSYNEQSGRYSVIDDLFYIPDARMQHKANKQMSSNESVPPELNERFKNYLNKSIEQYAEYKSLCDAGVSRELARIGLPQNIYTQFYYKVDLHNLLGFLRLRMAEDAQYEIRVYANEMFKIIEPLFPTVCSEFKKLYLNK